MRKLFLNLFIVFLGFFLFLIHTPHISYAATFTVNSTTDAVDSTPGDGICATAGSVCTVRAAIQEANALAGDDSISIPAGTFTLSIAGTGEDLSATGDLDVESNMSITGAGINETIIDGNGIDRVFDIAPSLLSSYLEVNFSSLSIQNGEINGYGGGICNNNSSTYLTLTNVSVNTNTVTNGDGGGMYTNSYFLTIEHSIFDSNIVTNGKGGGIDTQTGGSLTDVTISNNIADYSGGGLFYDNGSLLIQDSSIFGNSVGAGQGGGAYFNYGAALNRVSIYDNDAEDGGGVFVVEGTAFENVTIYNNEATRYGGGLHSDYEVEVVSSTIVNNTSPVGNGGGIDDSGYLFISNSLLSGNSGGNCRFDPSTTSEGGNISSDSTCSDIFVESGDQNNITLQLGLFGDNGGSINTIPLLSSSPAINSGIDSLCPSTDGRDYIRDDNCDVGAFEYNASSYDPTYLTDDFTSSFSTDPIGGNFTVVKDISTGTCGDNITLATPDQGSYNYWNDGGSDAFDSFGCSLIEINGVTQALPLYATDDGITTSDTFSVGGTNISVQQGWMNTNMYMIHIEKTGGIDQNVSFNISGNLGSDDNTSPFIKSFIDEGYQWNYCYSTDYYWGAIDQDDPAVFVSILSPKASKSQDATCTYYYDDLIATLNNSPLPLTIYVSWGYMKPNVFADWVANDWHSTTTVGVQSNSGSSPRPEGEYSTTDAPLCRYTSPLYAPDLFSIQRNGKDAVLHFTPIQSNTSYYFISYGTDVTAEGYSLEIPQPIDISGAITQDIHALNPNNNYYFKVRAGNNCMPGPWSGVVK